MPLVGNGSLGWLKLMLALFSCIPSWIVLRATDDV